MIGTLSWLNNWLVVNQFSLREGADDQAARRMGWYPAWISGAWRGRGWWG